MSTTAIHHAYNEVVATSYDLDPQGVIGRSLDHGIAQMKEEGLLDGRELHALDIGMGTGLFLEKLSRASNGGVVPFGIDLAENMLEVARKRLPGLEAVAGDASDFENRFPDRQFDAICTHFVTGYVPMSVLGPQIFRKLRPGGCWSLVGGTRHAYSALQAKGDSKLLRWLSGAGSRRVEDEVLNPADEADVARLMNSYGLEIARSETFRPELDFPDFDAFMDFGYQGGWLTPLIESLGLPKTGPIKKWLINRLVFPVKDHHDIVVVLGRKPR